MSLMLETKLEDDQHCGKSVQIRTFLWSVYFCIQFEYNKKGTEKTPYLDTFHAVQKAVESP